MSKVMLSARMSIPMDRAQEARDRVRSALEQIARECCGELVDVYTWDQMVHAVGSSELDSTAVPMDLQSMYQPGSDLPDDLAEEL